MRLFPVNGDDRKGVRKTEDVSFDEGVGGDDWKGGKGGGFTMRMRT